MAFPFGQGKRTFFNTIDHCQEKCNNGVDCQLTYLKDKCICKSGYENDSNGKCQPSECFIFDSVS